MKQDEWAERLRHHLKDYREEPKRDLWDGIEGALNEAAHRQARVVAIRRWVAAAVIAGLTGVGAYMLWPRQAAEDVKQPTVLAGNNQKQEPSHQDANEIDNEIVVTDSKSIAKPHIAQVVYEESEPDVSIAEEHSQPVEQKVEPQQESTTTQEPTPQQAPTTTKELAPQQDQPYDYQPRAFGRAMRYHHRVTMGLYASAGFGGYNNRNGVRMSQSLLSNFAMTRGDVPYLAGYEERQSHDQPISFGLTFSYPLTRKLSISSGVVYTKLNSDFTSTMRDNQIHRHQTLHYVGVPLNVQYNLWQWSGLHVYLAAGGQADWNVEAKANTDGVDQEMKKDDMQWSVGGSLGVQYNVVPQLGIYAEPGIKYYFDNGSRVSNFFKDKPTDFNLQLGLRVNF